MTFIDDVCTQIVAHPDFIRDYNAVVRDSVLSTIQIETSVKLEETNISKLVQSAAILAQSSHQDWRKAAYRIGVGTLPYGNALGGLNEVIRLTLARLGNYPAIRFAFPGDTDPNTLIPSAFYEIAGRRLDNTVHVGERSAVLTDLQKSVWEAVTTGNTLALSAPTSAGKSFVFQNYIESVKRRRPTSNIVYLVPSRALIGQVSETLRTFAADMSFTIATVPITFQNSAEITPVYVLTPERLQVLLHTDESIKFDVAIIDEAQLIGDGSRGIVLHSVLQSLVRRDPNIQLLFSSPQVRNPDIFGALVGRNDTQIIKTSDSPVAQNIIKVRSDPNDPARIQLKLWQEASELDLVELPTHINVYNPADQLIYCSWMLGAGAQNLVYAEGPAACETIALKFVDLNADEALSALRHSPTPNPTTVTVRNELSSFAKETVHSTYRLADTVLSGVGFHYGRIPTLLRQAIEDAFTQGHLDYIVCTSTLLQGVNLPARNIFMNNPHKGDDRPIESVDFWNLAGRAGRLGREFQGNVFLIDYDQWDAKPLSGPKDQPVTPSLEQSIVEQSDALIRYIETPDHESGSDPLLEAAFAKLQRDHRAGVLPQTLDLIESLTPEARTKLTEAIRTADEAISIPVATLEASPQLSGYRQQELYNYMIAKIRMKGPDYLIPNHPSSDWEPTITKLRPVFARVHKYLERKSGMHHLYWAPLALRWMRGDPLPVIIDSAISYFQRKGQNRQNPTIIREVLTDIETNLRFKYVNLLGCYTAVLKQALLDTHHADHVRKVPALTLYLELGACSQTMIQLMNFGLSRHTSSKLASFTINRDMDSQAAKAYLRRLNPDSLGLSTFLRRELSRILATL